MARYGGPISAAELVAGTATLPESNRVHDGDRQPVGGLATRRRVTPAVLGLVGIVIAFVGIAAMFAFEQAPFFDADEKAHLGYAHEIADFRLPEIERQPDVPASATQWQVERSTGRDSRYLGVWVANHPPLHYIAVAPLIWFSEITDRADGGLLLMRLANIAFAAAGVVFTYFLGKEVAGGERRVGLAAAAIVALVPQGHTYFSRGLNDGIAFAAGTALVWAAVRMLRSPDRRNLVLLGATAAAAAGTRTATMLLAVVVVAVVAADRLRPPPKRRRLRCDDVRRRSPPPSASALPPCCSAGSTSASSCSTAISGRRRSCSIASVGRRGAASPTCSRRDGGGPISTIE